MLIKGQLLFVISAESQFHKLQEGPYRASWDRPRELNPAASGRRGRDEKGDRREPAGAGRHGAASLDGVQPGSSPGTSLLHPRLAQPWGDLSRTLHRARLWPAPGGKSRGRTWLKALGDQCQSSSPPCYPPDPTLRSSRKRLPCREVAGSRARVPSFSTKGGCPAFLSVCRPWAGVF